MKRIGIISDTHLRDGSTRVIPQQVWEAFAGVQLILHGGDYIGEHVVEELSTLAPVLGVCGNNDGGEMGKLPVSRRVEIENVVIGLTHGDVAVPGNSRPLPLSDAPGNGQTAANALSHFQFDGDVACVVFGHSHHPMLQWREVEGRRVLLLNPGSPTDRRRAPHFGCAVFEVEGNSIKPQLITW